MAALGTGSVLTRQRTGAGRAVVVSRHRTSEGPCLRVVADGNDISDLCGERATPKLIWSEDVETGERIITGEAVGAVSKVKAVSADAQSTDDTLDADLSGKGQVFVISLPANGDSTVELTQTDESGEVVDKVTIPFPDRETSATLTSPEERAAAFDFGH